MGKRGQRARQLAVWLHVLTSVGWMAQALALVSLLALGIAGTDRETRAAALSMADHLDMTLMAPLANAAAFTGLLLAATTAWGLFRHWWVVAKFAITLVQIYLGIFVLSPNLTGSVVAVRDGAPAPLLPMLVGGALMAGAICTQAWFSIRKPWPPTPWAGRARPPTAPGWLFLLGVGATVVDLAVAEVLGFPLPAVSTIALVVALVARQRAVGAGAPRRLAGQLAG